MTQSSPPMSHDTAPIWRKPMSLEGLNASSRNTLMAHLGILYTDVGPDWLEATMPVDHRTHQPLGMLHGEGGRGLDGGRLRRGCRRSEQRRGEGGCSAGAPAGRGEWLGHVYLQRM